MSALDRRASPATVAPIPGQEREKMLQRFDELDAANRASLLDIALHMIERQRDASLSPAERRTKMMIERVERSLAALAEKGGVDSVETRVLQGILNNDRAELAKNGINYFDRAGQRRTPAPVAAPQRAARGSVRPHAMTPRRERAAAAEAWMRDVRRYYAASAMETALGYEYSIAADEGSAWTTAVAKAAHQRAFRRLVDVIDGLMLMPAVTTGALRWKQKHCRVDGGRPAWTTAIERDERELPNQRGGS